jgi:hypothetical protein
MSPRIPFRLDAEGYKRFDELLAAVGMRFVEHRREAMPAFRCDPELVVIHGELVSRHGTYPECELRSGDGEHSFVFTMRGGSKTLLAVSDDLDQAFAGHLIQSHEKDVA